MKNKLCNQINRHTKHIHPSLYLTPVAIYLACLYEQAQARQSIVWMEQLQNDIQLAMMSVENTTVVN